MVLVFLCFYKKMSDTCVYFHTSKSQVDEVNDHESRVHLATERIAGKRRYGRRKYG